MPNRNSSDADMRNNADGGQVGMGRTERLLKWRGADIIVSGAGSGTYTFPGLVSRLISIFGDGIDGDVTLQTGTVTLSRDMYYQNLTIPSGTTLLPNGFTIYVLGALTIQVGAVISANGGAGGDGVTTVGPGGSGGAGAAAAGFNAGGGNGGQGEGTTGASTGNGVAQSNASPLCANGPLRLRGGGGGCGGARHGTGDGLRTFGETSPYGPQGGDGGPSGGTGSTSDGGGGGGGGGGVIVIWANIINNAGIIQALGGNGGSGGGAANHGGNGGGGAGGVVLIFYTTAVGSGLGTTQVTGGQPGTVAGGGGTVGSNGTSASYVVV